MRKIVFGLGILLIILGGMFLFGQGILPAIGIFLVALGAGSLVGLLLKD